MWNFVFYTYICVIVRKFLKIKISVTILRFLVNFQFACVFDATLIIIPWNTSFYAEFNSEYGGSFIFFNIINKNNKKYTFHKMNARNKRTQWRCTFTGDGRERWIAVGSKLNMNMNKNMIFSNEIYDQCMQFYNCNLHKTLKYR